MALTFAFSLAASSNEPTGRMFKSPTVQILSIVGYLAGMITLFCSKPIRRSVPLNYILLLVVTVSLASMIAGVAAEFKALSVITAIMACCISTAGLFVAAMFTSTRINVMRNLVFGLVAAAILNLIVLLMMIFTMRMNDPGLVFAISLIMVVVVGIYIIFDLLQIIIPGIVDKDDYIFAALQLYIDIAYLFYYLLLLLGDRK